MLRLWLGLYGLWALTAQASWLDNDYTPQAWVSSSQPHNTERHGLASQAAPQSSTSSVSSAGFDPHFWVETSSVLTYAHEAAVLLFNQDHRYVRAQKMALGHYFHPAAFSAQFLQEQQTLEHMMAKEPINIQAYVLDSPQLDPTFKPIDGQWQVIFPMHQKVLKANQVVLEQDFAVRMRIQMRQSRDLSSWQVVELDVKPMDLGGDHHA